MTNLDSILKSRDITLLTKVLLVKAMVFPIVIYGYERWELDYKESWAPKNWCFWTVVLEKTLESPLGSKEIKPVNPQGNQPWIFIGRTDPDAGTSILPDAKNWLIGKIPDAGKDWRQEEKGTVEDEMVGWHHQLNGHEFEQVPGVGDGQGGLVCCSPWGRKESDTTEQLNGTELKEQCWVSQVALVVKNPLGNAGDIRYGGSIPGSGRAPGIGHSNLLQYSCLENLMDRGTQQTAVCGVTKSWTWLTKTSLYFQGVVCVQIILIFSISLYLYMFNVCDLSLSLWHTFFNFQPAGSSDLACVPKS